MQAAVNDHGKARGLLKKHPQLRECEVVAGENLLHYLAIESYAEAVDFLAEEGFAFDKPDEFGNTPLLHAAVVGSYEVADVLLRRGADPNTESLTMGTVLFCAIRSANPKLVKLLLDHGAKPDFVDDMGDSALDVVQQEVTLKRKPHVGAEIGRMLKEAMAKQSGD